MSEVVKLQGSGIDRSKAPEPELGSGPITGERYYSKEFAHREFEQMWSKVWLIACLEDEVRSSGDYITCEIGRESILCVRGEDDKIRAFYNVCQHRGNRLVHNNQGNTASEFACAYHGWRYDTRGILKWVYCEEDFPQGSPCGKRNLIEIPCESWAGFVWYNLDPDAKPLRDYLSPVAEQLDCYAMERMHRTHWVTLEGDFNWKCVQDNFNESYHLPYVHAGVESILDEHYSNCQFDLYASGHCRMLMPGGGPNPNYPGSVDNVFQGLSQELSFWDLDPEPFRNDLAKLRMALQAQKRKLGKSKGYDFSRYTDEQLTDHYHYTVFPNLSFSMKPDGCIFLRGNPHPTDPEKCLFDMWYLTLFPEGATEYYAASQRDWVSVDYRAAHETGKVGEVSCGPGIDQDVSIWSSQQQGLRSRGFKGEYMAKQERRIRYFHETLDRYLGN
ncbi:MAG: aromatic ring-hydroxylating dioxygenase subunit alpha [Gammaproteobacteria bacterium]|nr:aromatic ring-hydroxylating dioxygenase subunit alpha [Gammaproteobacteria bacterium]